MPPYPMVDSNEVKMCDERIWIDGAQLDIAFDPFRPTKSLRIKKVLANPMNHSGAYLYMQALKRATKIAPNLQDQMEQFSPSLDSLHTN